MNFITEAIKYILEHISELMTENVGNETITTDLILDWNLGRSLIYVHDDYTNIAIFFICWFKH